MSEKPPDLSIVIVNYNSGEFLEQCLDSVYTQKREIELETFVVDNGSSDNSWKMARERFPQVSLIRNEDNRGFSKANNQAIRMCRGRYILLLNPDTVLRAKALDNMVHFMDRNPRAGAAGAKLIDPQGTIQLSCRSFPSHRTALFNRYSLLTRLMPQNRFSREYLMSGWDHNTVREVDWVSGACLVMRREALDEIGLLDERFFMYAEDVDWCYRAKQKNWKIYFVPEAEAIHYIGQSSRKAGKKSIIEHHRSMYLFYRKHYQENFLLNGLTAGGIAIRAGFLLVLDFVTWCNKKCAKRINRGIDLVRKWLYKVRTIAWFALSDRHQFWIALKLKLRIFFSPPNSGSIFVNGIRFQIDLNLDPAMRQMYYGYYQSDIISLLRKYLREGDIFIDVGANVGYISAFALGLVGEAGEVHAFEPVPQYYERLQKVQDDNPNYHLYANRLALGKDSGISTIAVTNQPNIGWNTMVPELMSNNTIRERIDTRVIRLDDYLLSRKIRNVRLIKIDTEGYEFPVLIGLERYLYSTKDLPIVIAEIAPAAYTRLNTSLNTFSDFIGKLGYSTYRLDGKRKVNIDILRTTTDILFLPQPITKKS